MRLQPHLKRGGAHGAAIVGLQAQPALALLAELLPDAGPADQINGQMGNLALVDDSGHDRATPDVDHQVEAEPYALHVGGQALDALAPRADSKSQHGMG